MAFLTAVQKWLTPGIGIKRWLVLVIVGLGFIALGLAAVLIQATGNESITQTLLQLGLVEIVLCFLIGLALVSFGLYHMSMNILAPFRRQVQGRVVDVVYTHNVRQRGVRVVAVGGGTGLPSALRSLKAFTSNITAIVTVADDGGSSGRLRQDLGILPPGDLRNNIAALADDESFMTRLFQHRFTNGDLKGHAFGNIFIGAMSGITGSLETALIEIERVLNIQGRVLPSTLEDVTLFAEIAKTEASSIIVQGESNIPAAGGRIQNLWLEPEPQAYSGSIEAILNADIVVLGPGSLFTSILPNLLIKEISAAVRATKAYKIYICNIATQPGETDTFSVADHVLALEKYIGRGVFQLVLANNSYPVENAGRNTHYVTPAPAHHEILQRYEVQYVDLVDPERPWRHDPHKLAEAILRFGEAERSTSSSAKALSPF